MVKHDFGKVESVSSILTGSSREPKTSLARGLRRSAELADARFERSELKMEAKYERGFRQILVTTASLMVSGFIATIVAVVAR